LKLFCVFLLAGSLDAQLLDKLSANIGGGLSEPILTTGKNLNYGRNIQSGAGYNFSSRLGLMIELESDSFTITRAALNTLGVPSGFPDGHVHTRSYTLEPVWHFHPKGVWDIYATGGGGLYQRQQQLTAPTVATASGSNSFFGFNTPGYPSSEISLSYTLNKPGVDCDQQLSPLS
jgi:Outer membrane protein beta-barrel domain